MQHTSPTAATCSLNAVKENSKMPMTVNGCRRFSESSIGSEDAKTVSSHHIRSPILNGCQQIRKSKSCSVTQKTFAQLDGGESSRSNTPSPEVSNGGMTLSQNHQHSAHNSVYGTLPSHSSVVGEATGMWPMHASIMNWPTWCPQHNIGGPIMQSTPPLPLPVLLQTPPLGIGQTSLPENSGTNTTKKSIGSDSPRSQSCESAASLAGSPHSKSSPQTDSSHQKISPFVEESLVGKPCLKIDQIFGSQMMNGVRPPMGMIPSVASPLMMVPCYQYSPFINSPWCHWSAPSFMSRYTSLPTNLNSHYCSSHNPSHTPMSSLSIPYQFSNAHSNVMENTYHWSHLPKLHSSPNCPTHQMSQNKKIVSYDSGCKAKPLEPKPNHSSKVDNIPLLHAWPGFQSQQTSSLHTKSVCTLSPSKRTSISVLGESVKNMQRLAQHPDDRCALLPISPPLTPLTNVSTLLSMSPNHLAPIN